MKKHSFELVTDGIPYIVKVIPYKFNSETRYRVRYNGGEENIFAWDPEVNRIRAIDDESTTIPDAVEISIGEKLLAFYS